MYITFNTYITFFHFDFRYTFSLSLSLLQVAQVYQIFQNNLSKRKVITWTVVYDQYWGTTSGFTGYRILLILACDMYESQDGTIKENNNTAISRNNPSLDLFNWQITVPDVPKNVYKKYI